jgi:hypothetical protein
MLPVLVNVTGVELPGGIEPRLNWVPGVVEITLWMMLSSFRNTNVSPFLIATSASENILPFCLIVRSAASATAVPDKNAIANMTLNVFIFVSWVGSDTFLSRQHRHSCGINITR